MVYLPTFSIQKQTHVGKYACQKSNIDTKKIAILKGSRYLFQGPSFWAPPAVSFQECTLH